MMKNKATGGLAALVLAGAGLVSYAGQKHYIHNRHTNQSQLSRPASQPESAPTSRDYVNNLEKSAYQHSGEIHISNEGLEVIKKYESYSAKAYFCPAGKKTIGWGHVVLKNERLDRIDIAQAEKILRKDVSEVEEAIEKYVRVPLTQKQYDALCSFVFNAGAGNFNDSNLLKQLNLKNYNGAAAEFNKWVCGNGRKLPGLVNRRAEEKRLFLSDNKIQKAR